MIHLIKLYTCLLIVVCAARFIDASCLSYGHSCYGAHGKRSFVPQRDLKNNDINRWAPFKFNERNEMYPLRKMMRENSLQRFSDNEASMNLPAQFPSYDEEGLRNYADMVDDSEVDQQKQLSPRVVEPYQAMRLSKQMTSLNTNAQ